MKVHHIAVVLAVAVAGGLASTGGTARAQADQPWVVSVGDSYISGEAGRWAGNTAENPPDRIDALGPTAYFDNADNTAERIPGCHRSRSAEIHIGGGVKSENLACSGATTATQATEAAPFKPGIDFYHDRSSGRKGQALMLQEFAAKRDVKLVAVSIGGNDFGFGSVVAHCVVDFMRPLLPDHCHDDPEVLAVVEPAFVAARVADIAQAYRNIHTAMAKAGRNDSDYTILVQGYPAAVPAPAAGTYRYGETYARQFTGGCGLYNDDSDWATNVFMPTVNGAIAKAIADSGLPNIRTMDLTDAFSQRRLCEKTVGHIEDTGLQNGWEEGAQDRLEWVFGIVATAGVGNPYQTQESLHPSYWGQLALRNCLRQAYRHAEIADSVCVRGRGGLNQRGEPVMALKEAKPAAL